jgi:RNA polymerase sigma-70 factor (ECF subfamily)
MNIEKSKDETIVAKIIAGDVELYGELMARYEQKLIRYVTYLARDQVFASDIVQDTFIKAYQNLRGFDKKYKFSSWVYRIAHNETMNAIKKEKHINRQIDIDELQDYQYDSSVITDIDRKILNTNLQACLDGLENKYREILMLQYYENMKYADIADILMIPTSTVGVRANRAKIKLRDICQQKGVKYE